MSLKGIKLIGTTAVLAASAAFALPANAQITEPSNECLWSDTLSQGEALQVITELKSELEQHGNDPALLINLGIAQAQSGQVEDARKSFQAAMRSRTVLDLETANGTTTDSRRLARLAMAMLERGEFRAEPPASRFTLRD